MKEDFNKRRTSRFAPPKLQTILQQEPIGAGGYGDIFRVEGQKQGQQILKKRFKELDPTKQKRLQQIVNFLQSIDPRQGIFTGLLKKKPALSGFPETKVFFMKQSGKSLRNLVQEMVSLEKRKERCVFALEMLQLFPNLMKGLDLLIHHQVIHGDIKLDNIVYDKAEKKLRFIDYDFVGTKDEYINASRNNFNFPMVSKDFIYEFWPLERYNIFSWGKVDENKLSQIMNQLKSRKIVSNKILKEMYDILVATNPNRLGGDPLKIDIYSLGIVAYELFINSKFYRCFVKNDQERKQIKDMLETMIVRNMLHPIPSERKLPIKEWMEFTKKVEEYRSRNPRTSAQQRDEYIRDLLKPLACLK